MKITISLLCCVGLLFSTGLASAATDAQYVPPPPGQPDNLELMVAPIALYPDPLVAVILPASTASTDIVLAARYFSSGGGVNAVETQPWDDSVKALAHYPELVQWMNENLSWTREIGDAYYNQPEAVMTAIQRSRARALANGTLISSAQQQVVIENGHILILPAQSKVIYIPRYDPEIIYVSRPYDYYSGPLISYGMGFSVGWWLGFYCDWGHSFIWFDQYHRRHWRDHDNWRRRAYVPRTGHQPPDGWRRWKPRTDRDHHRPSPDRHRPGGKITRPKPPPGAPPFDRHHPRTATPRVNHEPRPRHSTQPVVPEVEHKTPSTVVHRPMAPTPAASPSRPSTPYRSHTASSPRPQHRVPSRAVVTEDRRIPPPQTHRPATTTRPTTASKPTTTRIERHSMPAPRVSHRSAPPKASAPRPTPQPRAEPARPAPRSVERSERRDPDKKEDR